MLRNKVLFVDTGNGLSVFRRTVPYVLKTKSQPPPPDLNILNTYAANSSVISRFHDTKRKTILFKEDFITI